VCNLYNITKGQKAIRGMPKAVIDHAGNTPSLRAAPKGQRELLMLPAVFPSHPARSPYRTWRQ
jgi:hypothetical protein